MTIRRTNPRRQGLIGLGAALDWFTRNGYLVSLPIAEDERGVLFKVQVKTTARNATGNFVVSLQTSGGNQSFHTRKPFDHSASDLLFVLTDEDEIYVIPREISLYSRYDRYRRSR